MTKAKNNTQAKKLVIGLGAFLGALTVIFAFWNNYGWVINKTYAVDKELHAEIHLAQATKASIVTLTALVQTIAKNQSTALSRDEWVCDRLDGEIPKLQKDLQAASASSDKIDIQRVITKKNEIWQNLDCSTF